MKTEDGKLKIHRLQSWLCLRHTDSSCANVLNAVAAGEKDEKTLMEGFMKGLGTATKELGEPFIAESIWTEAFLDVLRGGGKTKDGKVLYTDQTPYGERVSAVMKHLVRAQAPFSAATNDSFRFCCNRKTKQNGWTLHRNRTNL